jgi:hypothetical protein
MSKHGPPGWQPHLITNRVDGWVCDPENPERMPRDVAEAIFRAMPQIGNGETVAEIKVRMLARMRAAGLSYD